MTKTRFMFLEYTWLFLNFNNLFSFSRTCIIIFNSFNNFHSKDTINAYILSIYTYVAANYAIMAWSGLYINSYEIKRYKTRDLLVKLYFCYIYLRVFHIEVIFITYLTDKIKLLLIISKKYLLKQTPAITRTFIISESKHLTYHPSNQTCGWFERHWWVFL